MSRDVPASLRAALGLAVALLLTGGAVIALEYGNGAYDRGYRVEAVFPTSSQGLFTDGASAVKLRGIDVGEVDGIDLQQDGTARVTLLIESGVRLPDTTMASIEPLSVFGPKFVRLEPGAHADEGPYLDDGDEIAETHTQRELTDILASTTRLFESIDPLDIVTTIDAVAEGTAGLGDQIGGAIDASAVLAGVASAHTDELSRFLADAALLTGTLADHDDDLVTINDDLGSLARLVNEDPRRIDALLATTTDISSTFADLLRDNAENLDTTIESVGSFIAAVDAESDEIPDFLDLIGTFFGRLSDVIRFEGPEGTGTKMAAIRGFISLDLCLVYGVCAGGEAGIAPAEDPTAVAPQQATAAGAGLAQALRDAEPIEGRAGALVDGLLGEPVGAP